MAHSGLRPEVLGSYRGNDGLRVRDLPDLEVGKTEVSIKSIPARIIVRRELSKARHQYLTFLGEEGCRYLKEYLDERLRSGATLRPESDVISPTKFGKEFVRANNIGDMIRKVIRKAGYDWRPYVLRAYFDTQLLLAESKGKVAHDYRVFWMGHKGSMEARYTTNKGRLPAALVDDMREAYSRCESFLSTVPGPSEGQVDAAVNRQFLRIAGYSDEEIEELDLADTEKVRELARERLTSGMAPAPVEAPAPHPATYQIVVDPAAATRLVGQGWRRIDRFSDHEVLMESPSNPGTSPTPAPSSPAPAVGAGQARLGAPRATGGGAGAALPPSSGRSSSSSRRPGYLRPLAPAGSAASARTQSGSLEPPEGPEPERT
jgi:hypothetical protein